MPVAKEHFICPLPVSDELRFLFQIHLRHFKKLCVRTTRKSTWSGEVNVQLTSAIVSDPLRKDLLNPANLNQVDQAGSESKHLENKKNHNPSLTLNELNKACK